MAGQPRPVHAPLFNTIIDELNTLAGEDLDEFTRAKRLHGLEAKALALGDHDLALGYSALSSVAAARGDEQKMRRYHDNALEAGSLPAGVRALLQSNFSVSLAILGKFEEAHDVALRMHVEDRNDLYAIGQLATLCMEMGDEEQYLHFARLYASLAGTPHHTWEQYLAELAESEQLSSLCTALTARSMAALRD